MPYSSQPFRVSMPDAALLESRRLTQLQICVLFGVPPFLIPFFNTLTGEDEPLPPEKDPQ